MQRSWTKVFRFHSHGEGLGIVQTAMENQADVRRHRYRRINLINAIKSFNYDNCAHRLTLHVNSAALASFRSKCNEFRLGKASTSGAFVKKHALTSASSAQKAVAKLLEEQLITYSIQNGEKEYSLTDKFLELWIRKTY